MRRIDNWKMNLLWLVVKLYDKMFGKKLLTTDYEMKSDGWGDPMITISTQVKKPMHRIAIIAINDRLKDSISAIRYCFNRKDHE